MSSFALTKDERNALMEQVYGGFQRSPLMTKGNKATAGAARQHKNAGKIDYYAYGGEVSGDYNDRRAAHNLEYYQRKKGKNPPGHDKSGYAKDWRNRNTWSKIADHLGIKDVDSESDLRQMYDFVKGYKFEKEDKDDKKETYIPLPTQPDKDKPKEVQDAVKDYEDSKLENPGNQQPKFSDLIKTDLGGNPTSDPNLDAIKHGDDLNEWYQTKFVPHLEKEAHATSHEVGNSTRYFIDKFVFEPSQLGDIKELFKYYSGKIKKDDDD